MDKVLFIFILVGMGLLAVVGMLLVGLHAKIRSIMQSPQQHHSVWKQERSTSPQVFALLLNKVASMSLNNNDTERARILEHIRQVPMPVTFIVDNKLEKFEYLPRKFIAICTHPTPGSKQLAENVKNAHIQYLTWNGSLFVASVYEPTSGQASGMDCFVLIPLPDRGDLGFKSTGPQPVSTFLGRSSSNQSSSEVLQSLPDNAYLVGY